MPIIRNEFEHAIAGEPGRMFAATARPDEAAGLFCSQTWKSEPRPIAGYGDERARMVVTLRFDDECGNGHNSFAITADVYANRPTNILACGAMHEEIARTFPELEPLLKWHLCSSDAPLHYIANTLYLAGDRDCWGLRKGERKALTDRKGAKLWELKALNSLGIGLSDTPTGREYIGAATVPLFILQTQCKGETPPLATPELAWVQSERVGEGKARELDAARRSAIWPEATDEELLQEPAALRAALKARHPALMDAFKRAMLEAGFLWAPELARHE